MLYLSQEILRFRFFMCFTVAQFMFLDSAAVILNENFEFSHCTLVERCTTYRYGTLTLACGEEE